MDTMTNSAYNDPIARPAAHEEDGKGLNTGLVFLAENPEVFGMVSDACPVSMGDLLLAANGHSAEGGAISPGHSVESPDPDRLFDTVFSGLLPQTDDNTAILRATFGGRRELREHLVSRYCATLCEAVALQVFRGPAKGASPEQTAILLGRELKNKLGGLRTVLHTAGSGTAPGEAVFFTVSFAACRVRNGGEGIYHLDIFSAGDFRIYLLDRFGLCPLWVADTPVLSPDADVRPSVKTVSIHHPDPFALFLLSDSVCSLNAAEHRLLREKPGMIWRYRMRLEDRLLRLVTDCVWENEFGERAERYFTGRSNGRDSASGAMLLRTGGRAYEVLRSDCRKRLTELETVISLLPEGYDPDNRPVQSSRVEAERAYLRRLLDRDPTLEGRLAEAMRLCALEKLGSADEKSTLPPDGVPSYVRLSREEVQSVFRRFDCENDDDNALMAENRMALREGFSEHWVTLRPVLLATVAPPCTPEARAARAEGDRLYGNCVMLGERLSSVLAGRREAVGRIEALLTEALEVLDFQGEDWLCGRAGSDSAAVWAQSLESRLPALLEPLRRAWAHDTDVYRGYLTAYRTERENLFRMDVADPNGPFAADWRAICDGVLSAERWETLRGAVAGHPGAEACVGLMDSLCRVSRGTGALAARVRRRGAEERMARELASRPDLCLDALRGAVNEDADWGDDVLSLVDGAIRAEYRSVVRRWQETRELHLRQAEAFEAYRSMYESLPCKK